MKEAPTLKELLNTRKENHATSIIVSTKNNSEEGMVIAKLDLADGTVEYIDEAAKTDEYAQTVIKEMLENRYILTE